MESTPYEARIILALEALKSNTKLSFRAAAKLYNIQRTTLQNRHAGKLARRERPANSRKLTDLEEETIVQYILELDTRSFPPRLAGVEDMANQLLRTRDTHPVGKLWAHNFVKRQPKLRMRYSRRYDYQRAQCEDPKTIGQWFSLVRNIKAKYGILDEDIYNFDETGFMMGMIFPGMVVTTSEGRTGKAKLAQPGNREWATVIQGINASGWAIPPFIILAAKIHLSNWYMECGLPPSWSITTTDNGWTTNEVGMAWIKHFELHTASRTKGIYRLLVLDGHESHHSTQFELYCQEHKIITLCMPPHSSHLLQPLDVGCFGPLKQAYGRQVEGLMRMHINHISKLEFLRAFRDAFFTSLTEKTIQGGFIGAGLVPLDPQKVLSKLDIQLQTPSPPGSSEGLPPWVSKTPQNPIEASCQSELIKTRITNHQNSSPTSMLYAVDQLSKGTTAIMHQVTLLRTEVEGLRKANEALSKRRRAKKTRVRLGGTLTVQEAEDLLVEKDVAGQIAQGVVPRGGSGEGSRTKIRCCGVCGKPGHNARTCQEVAESSDSAVSDVIEVII